MATVADSRMCGLSSMAGPLPLLPTKRMEHGVSSERSASLRLRAGLAGQDSLSRGLEHSPGDCQ